MGFRVFKAYGVDGDHCLIILIQKKANALKVITPIYGLSEYYPFSAGLALSRGTYSTMPVPQPLHNIPYVILMARSSPTLSGPHQLMTSVL
jgi:hypothetical protein